MRLKCLKEVGLRRLRGVEVAIPYQSVVDDLTLRVRGVSKLKEMVKELRADFIFGAFWKRRQDPQIYATLREVIKELRSVKPGVIIVGSLPPRRSRGATTTSTGVSPSPTRRPGT